MNDAASGVPLVAFLPSAWKPRHRGDLVRLGSDFDGGYVVTENIIRHTDFLVGLGVGTDWTFEGDFHKRKGCPVHCYDHSIGVGQYTVDTVRNVKKFLRRPRLRYISQHYLSRIFLPLKYKSFFTGNKKHFKEEIGDDPEYHTDFNKIFSRIPATDKVFIKMDIEGWEYRALSGLEDHYDRLTGLVVEFHDLSTMLDIVRSHIIGLTKSFNIIHVHVNNYAGTDDRGIPNIIEVTFESKNFSLGTETQSERAYPVDGLDSPNIEHHTDYRLEFRD